MADNDDSLQDFKSDPSQLIERETHALAEFDRDFHPDGSRDDQDNPLDQTSNAQASGGGKMSSFDLVCPEDDLYDESLSKESLSEAGQDSLDTMLEFIQHSSLSVAEAAFNQLTQGEYASIEPLANSFSKPQAGSERLSSEEENEISKEDFPNTETSCESVSQEGGLEAKHQKNKTEHLNPTCTNSYKKLNNNLDEVKSEDGNDVYSSNSPYFDEAQKKSDSYLSNQANEWEHLGARPKHRPPKKFNNSLDSSSPVDLIPPQVVEPAAHGVHNPLLPEHLEDKKVGHEYWEWMASDEVGLLSRLPDTETRETLKDIPQHTQFSFLLDQINELKEKVEQLTKEVKLQEEEILALKLQRREKNIFQPHTEDVRECEPCATRGSSSDFYHKKGNLRNETHLVDKSGAEVNPKNGPGTSQGTAPQTQPDTSTGASEGNEVELFDNSNKLVCRGVVTAQAMVHGRALKTGWAAVMIQDILSKEKVEPWQEYPTHSGEVEEGSFVAWPTAYIQPRREALQTARPKQNLSETQGLKDALHPDKFVSPGTIMSRERQLRSRK